MLNTQISSLSQKIITPIGHSILNSIANQMRNGMNEFIVAFDLDDTITASNERYGGRAIVTEYKKISKEKYGIDFGVKSPISSIEDVRVSMEQNGLTAKQISDIEDIASKNYASKNIVPELTTNFAFTIDDIKLIKKELGNSVSFNIITNREKHIGQSDIKKVEDIYEINFDNIIYAQGMERKPSIDMFFKHFDKDTVNKAINGKAGITMVGDTLAADGTLASELSNRGINASYIYVGKDTNRILEKPIPNNTTGYSSSIKQRNVNVGSFYVRRENSANTR